MSAQNLHWHKEWRTNGAAAQVLAASIEASLWQYEGQPSHGAVPGTTFSNPDNTTAGSLMQASPASSQQQWIHSIVALIGSLSTRAVLYDRLLHISGLSGTVTTAQNINGGADATLTRWGPNYTGLGGNTTGEGNEIFLEIYTAIGVTATTVTAAYKNQAGASKTTQAVTFGGTGRREVDRIVRLPLAAGDTGVQSVSSVTVLASTGTAGNFGLVVGHRVNEFCLVSGTPELWSPTFTPGGPAELLPGACLAWTITATAAVTSVIASCLDAFICLMDN